jgi:membrane associated rhomboid family serine protease
MSEETYYSSICNLGVIPAELTGSFNMSTQEGPCPTGGIGWPALFTSMFSHGSWMHLIGNMWFLWIFGNNIEDAMGHMRFMAFFILTGLIADGAHIFLSPDSSIPTVGASGAISGIMGAYFILYPKARIETFVFYHVMPIPAWAFLGIWMGMQFLGLGAPETGDGGGIAYAAHLGGLFAGLGLVFLFRKTKPATAWI